MIVEVSLIHIMIGVAVIALVFGILGVYTGYELGTAVDPDQQKETMVWAGVIEKHKESDDA